MNEKTEERKEIKTTGKKKQTTAKKEKPEKTEFKKVIVTAPALNVRSAASLDSPVREIIPRGTVLTPFGETTPGWLEIPGGYVMEKYTAPVDENR